MKTKATLSGRIWEHVLTAIIIYCMIVIINGLMGLDLDAAARAFSSGGVEGTTTISID
ncbi:hypothetical protein ACEUZ9_004664 [Paracoccus litorisediminis]|uniref:hypothetical protein n=1 Tax=Paracoccus litorisediminis TaxID=2006130 RepID=UPI00373024B4